MSLPPLPPDELHLLYILLDSNLPTGGFVSSSGLESYVKHGFLGLPSDISPYTTTTTTTAGPSNTGAFPGGSGGAQGRERERDFTAVKGTKDVIRGVTDFADAEVGHYARTTGCFVRDAWEAVDRHLRSDQGEEEEEETNKVLETITTLDEYHESTLLSYVARRASKAQGIAMLTLFGRGLTRPLGFELDPNDEEGGAGSELEREKEKKSTAIIDGYKRLVRKGSVPGHLAICWGVITASLGLALERSLHLYLFLHARSLLSTAVRMNIIGPYASSQMLLHPFKRIIERESAIINNGNESTTTGLSPRTKEEKEDFWAWTKEAELGPATTWPLGEVLMGRHDMQHSRIFNS